MALRWINFHLALKTAGTTLITVFGMVYLYKLGISFPYIFLIYAAIQMFRMLVRPFLITIAARAGLKNSLIAATFLHGVNFLILSQVEGISWWLWLYILWSGVGQAIYWTSYHVYFAMLSSKERRGEDIGTKEAIVTLARALAPLASGFAIVYFGFSATFIIASILVFLAAMPLFFLPSVEERVQLISLKESWRTSDKRAFFAHFGHGWYEAGLHIWSLVVFLLVANYAVAGSLASLIVIFQMVAFLLIGKFVDRGHGYFIAHVALGLLAIVILGRAGLAREIPIIIALDAIFALAMCFYGPALDTILYNGTQEAKSAWGFQILSETSCDIGYILSWLFAAISTSFGLSLYWALVWTLGGVMVMFFVFRNYYGIKPISERAPVTFSC